MDFRLRERRYFVAVAEELHFARAAARLGMHQSPLSKAITLITRRNTQLTQIGEEFLTDAKRILAEVDRASRGIRAAARGCRGRLTIALADGVAHPRIAKLLAQTRLDNPDADIHVQQIPFRDQRKALRVNTLDIGLGLETYNDVSYRAHR